MNKYQLWKLGLWIATLTLILIIFIGIITNNWSYTFRFEMDNNTLEAIKSLNWTAIQNISR
jgi:hypothetical protein